MLHLEWINIISDSFFLWHDSDLIDKQNVTLSYLYAYGSIDVWKIMSTGWMKCVICGKRLASSCFCIRKQTRLRLNPIVIIIIFYLVIYCDKT